MGLESLNSIGAYSTTGNIYEKTTQNPYVIDEKSTIIVRDSETGKTYKMTYEQYVKYLHDRFVKNKPQDKKENSYELGSEKNGVRTIDVENVTESTKAGSSAPKDYAANPEKYQEYKNNIEEENGLIDKFAQGKRGDCYLLASIEAIKNTKEGQEILQKNVQENSDGSYTITLPGAVVVRNHYIEIGEEDKCAITGRYTITKAAIEKAKEQSGRAYAFGDINVILLELAMEAFRAEVAQTNKALGQKSERYIAGLIGPCYKNDPLSGGEMYDAIFMLTGQKSDVYDGGRRKKETCKLYKPGEYGYVGENSTKLSKGNIGKNSDLVEVNQVYDKDSDLQKLLDKYAGKEDQFCITVGFMVAVDGPDGTTKAGGGHALTVTKITDKYVEVVNPWNTARKERIPRGDFEKMACALTVTEMSKDKVDKYYEEKVNKNQEKKNVFNWLFK